jgi:hypothetical protein
VRTPDSNQPFRDTHFGIKIFGSLDINIESSISTRYWLFVRRSKILKIDVLAAEDLYYKMRIPKLLIADL